MEPLAALNEALAAWRKTREPRFAAIADWATVRALKAAPARKSVGMSGKKADAAEWLAVLNGGDPLDVSRLVGAIGGGKSPLAAERVTLLGKLDDPRVVTGLLALLEKPPYRAGTAIQFFRAAAKVLGDANDPRVRAALLDLAERYPAIIETSIGPHIASLLRRTAETLDQVKPAPLKPELEKKCAALEALFETEKSQAGRTRATEKSAEANDDALLAAIYAAPDDDGPRLVFADTLTERGDGRGEFISLQLARAQGVATPAQRARERELLADAKHKAAWSLPLAQGGACRLERGFPTELALDPRSVKTVVDLPALATLKKVTGLDREPPLKHVTALLFSPHARHLDSVDGLTRKLFEALDRPLPWREVGLRILPTRAELTRLTGVRRLSVANGLEAHTTLHATAFADVGSLEALHYGSLNLPVPEAFAPLVNVRELSFPGWSQSELVGPLLRVLPRLTTLELGFPPAAVHLQGLKLERLTVRGAVELRALLDAVPTLRELTLTNLNFVHDRLAPLLGQAELGRLQRATFGALTFVAPFTEQGVLEVRPLVYGAMPLGELPAALAVLPEGCVRRLVVRPMHADPTAFSGQAPAPEALAELERVTRVPVELAWS